jgi:hypothetical protein
MVVLLALPVSIEASAAGAGIGGSDDRRYIVADALFLQRTNATLPRSIAVTEDAVFGELPALRSRALVSPVAPGLRLFYGDNGSGTGGEGLGWEVGYLGVYGMAARQQRVLGEPSLQAPGELGLVPSGFNDGVVAEAAYGSELNSAEANLVFHRFDGGYCRSSPRPWQRCHGYDGGHVDWLAGFRWAGLEETATLGFQPPGVPAPNVYGVRSSSNLFAAQTGVRGRMAFDRWALEGWAKVGLAGTSLDQSQSMSLPLASLEPWRSPRSSSTGGMGMIADMNLSAVWRLSDVWGLRAGYNLIWLTGVALAPDQWDFSARQDAGAGTAIRSTGSVFFNGANLGAEARW